MPRTKGATADKPWNEAVRRAVYRECEGDDGKKVKRLNAIADKLCRMAIEGDMAAIKEIGDRLDGKPTQPNENKTDVNVTITEQVVNDANAFRSRIAAGATRSRDPAPSGKPH